VIRARNWAVTTITATDDRFNTALSRGRLIIMAIVGLVLVVACTNLANLVLARGSSRRHELAVRRALGASRMRLILEELAETALLALMGAAGAFVVARVLMNLFGSVSVPISETLVVQLMPEAGAGTWVLAGLSLLGSLVVFGIAPAVQLTRSQLRSALGSEAGSTGELRWRTKRVLISLQVMISLAFFLIAAFAVRIALFEQSRPSGVDVERLAGGTFNFRLPPWSDVTARDAVDRVLTVAAQEPAIERAAVSSGLPFGTPFTPSAAMTTPEKPFLTGRSDYPDALLLAATPGILETLGISIVRGRGIESQDVAGSAPVVVLSQLAARHAFGSSDVIGRELHLRYSGNSGQPDQVSVARVIGIAEDTDTVQRLTRRTGVVYLPLAQHYEPWLMLVARTRDEPADLVPVLRTVVKRAVPDLALDRAGPAALLVNGPFVLVDLISRAAGGLALLAMALAMAGLFGVMSHLVSRRTRELGLRLALGAEPGQIRRLVIRDGLAPVGSGLIMGLIIGFLVRWLMWSAYNAPLTLTDAVVFVLAPLPIVIAAVVACYWPARRASRVEPNVALRDL
jgi:putative ABC transport system permease protein